jgi:hypothetical protein
MGVCMAHTDCDLGRSWAPTGWYAGHTLAPHLLPSNPPTAANDSTVRSYMHATTRGACTPITCIAASRSRAGLAGHTLKKRGNTQGTRSKTARRAVLQQALQLLQEMAVVQPTAAAPPPPPTQQQRRLARPVHHDGGQAQGHEALISTAQCNACM